MTRALIYKCGHMYRVLDMNREVVVGVYYTPAQARHAWVIYEAQGCVGCGYDPHWRDEQVIDELRRLHEDKIMLKIRAGRNSGDGCETRRDREIAEAIDRLSTGL